MTSASMGIRNLFVSGIEGSAAANGDDDFELVAIHDLGVAMLAARHDFTVHFDGDAFAGQVEFDY